MLVLHRFYGYFHRHSDITKLGEIKDEINDHLQRFNFQLSDNLLLTDEAFVKWTAANFHLTVNRDIVDQGEVFPGTPFMRFLQDLKTDLAGACIGTHACNRNGGSSWFDVIGVCQFVIFIQ